MTRQAWADSFTEGQELWMLRSNGKLAEFLSKDKPNNDPHGRQPVYHVWDGDRWLYCGQSGEAASRIYAEALREEKIYA